MVVAWVQNFLRNFLDYQNQHKHFSLDISEKISCFISRISIKAKNHL